MVACNTASSFALEALSESSPVPVVGVVLPGARAALTTGAQRIGVIGTEGTIRSAAYQEALCRARPAVEVRAEPCPLLVPLAEEGWGDHPITDQVARHYLQPLLDWGAQTIILGCTHYPLLKPSLQRVVGPDIRLVDSASAVAEAVISDHSELIDTSTGVEGDVLLQLTDASDRFLRITRDILGSDPEHLEVVDIDSAPLNRVLSFEFLVLSFRALIVNTRVEPKVGLV